MNSTQYTREDLARIARGTARAVRAAYPNLISATRVVSWGIEVSDRGTRLRVEYQCRSRGPWGRLCTEHIPL